MAPTVADILKASGVSAEAIAAFDANALKGFETVLSTAAQAEVSAQQAREAAELAKRAQQEQYDQRIAPALDAWGNEKVSLEAERNFYKTQAEGARSAGFIPQDAPGYKPPANDPSRGADGKYVAGAGTVPGSPQYMTQQEGLRAVTNASWVISEHIRLHGAPPPDDIEALSNESAQQHQDFRTYASKKYNFDGKRAEIAAAAKQKERDEIVRETEARKDKEYAERYGNNPNVRTGAPSQFSELKKGVDAKSVKDPLMMTKQERQDYTRNLIQKDIVEHAGASR